ncbi:MAG: hypothetical protein A2231_07505 [Candidatus Firestonebacteria bacterium RIFOXYA2_FULL_40_8]|nr:MAG: hypothetical protein A2231_07505 [Candidatus Firestonebacteria bacterium RIFOXYA2_FULL_40_8]
MKNLLDERLSDVSPQIYKKLLEIERMAGQFSVGASYAPALLERLKKAVLITSTGASTRIEGSTLTDQEIEVFIQNISIQKLENRDEQEVKGYYDLMLKIFDSWRDIEISESTIRQFNNDLLKYVPTEDSNRGKYKTMDNSVAMVKDGKIVATIFKTTPPLHTPKKMNDLLTWTKEALDQSRYPVLLVTANFLVEYLAIHPFKDGNGRSSRALTNLILLKHDYSFMPYVSHEKFIEDNKKDYYLALRRSQRTFGTKKESISAWLDLFVEVVYKQAEQASKLLSRENIENLLSKKQLAVWTILQSVPDASIEEIANKTSMNRSTVDQAITKLIKLKKVERIGFSVATRYRKIAEYVDYKI